MDPVSVTGAGCAGPGPEECEEDWEQEEAVEEPEHDHEDDHLGEGDDHVAGVPQQGEHTQHSCGGA